VLTENGVDTPPANTFSISIRTRREMSATGGSCPSVRLQLKHQRHTTEIWRSLYSPVQNSFISIMKLRIRAYSGSDIFCKFVKKSLLRIVEADKMLPERLVTTFVTSSGNAIPSARSTRFSGFKASIPSASSSFSNVLITNNAHQYTIAWESELAPLPGRFFTKASKSWYVSRVSGSVDCKNAWKTMSSKYRRRL
jgi:hypothetical protein